MLPPVLIAAAPAAGRAKCLEFAGTRIPAVRGEYKLQVAVDSAERSPELLESHREWLRRQTTQAVARTRKGHFDPMGLSQINIDNKLSMLPKEGYGVSQLPEGQGNFSDVLRDGEEAACSPPVAPIRTL